MREISTATTCTCVRASQHWIEGLLSKKVDFDGNDSQLRLGIVGGIYEGLYATRSWTLLLWRFLSN
jgi:hypothetical protein